MSRHPSRSNAVPARSHRFTAEQRARALGLIAAGVGRVKVAEAVGCSTESLRRWCQAAEAIGAVPTPQPAASSTVEPAAPPPVSSAPKDPGFGLGEHEVRAILDYKRKHPSMGPAQLRAQLKRFHGWRISLKAIARVLRGHGYQMVHRGARPKGEVVVTW